MATVIYQCPETQSLHLLTERIRPLEFFAIDDADPDQVADMLAQGYDIGLFETSDLITEIGESDPNVWHPHNPHHLSD